MVFYVLNLFGVGTFTFLHWLLAISIGILLLDAFFQSEIFSYIGVFLFASYFNGLFELILPIQWSIVSFVLFFLVALTLYYTLWKRFVCPFIYGLFLHGATREPIETARGQIAVFRNIDDSQFVEWNGELWNAKGDPVADHEKVRILKIEAGIALYQKISNER